VRVGTGWSTDAIAAQRADDGRDYHEFLRTEAMSAGIYALGPGATDPQTPHAEDELYYVVRGRGRFQQGDDDQEVGPGHVLFVPAREPHHFHDVTEELVLLVVFAPPESDAGRPAPVTRPGR
jgi:mannose-6-phosphate isomerase-like protein (cupin superfamily)